MAEAPDLPGSEVTFVVLDDGSVILDDELPEPAVEPIAEELDQVIDAPVPRGGGAQARRGLGRCSALHRRARATRRRRESTLMLTMQDGTKSFSVDGSPEFGTVPELERFAAERYGSYVAEASRLDGELWEVRVSPL